jgi:alpha-tubulin suppressor-like RCC1 family protein
MPRTIVATSVLLAFMIVPACDDPPLTCGIIYVYDPVLDTCTCPPGSVLKLDGTCMEVGDAGSAEDGCSSGPEVCNGIDDDCDGVVDGPPAIAGCGTATNAVAADCQASRCVASACEDGYADCDSMFENGCETELATITNCGACGDTCGWDCNEGTCDDAVSAAGGLEHTCVLREAGDVACWGANELGQLGDGTIMHRLTAVPVPELTDATAITGGAAHNCVIRASGRVWCWGRHEGAILGAFMGTRSVEPVEIGGFAEALAISAGTGHTCALVASGGVRCWGLNAEGQLGDGTTTNRSTPVAVPGVGSALAIAAGGRFTCAATMDRVRCWGTNEFEQLGADRAVIGESATPIEVSGVSRTPRALAAGEYHVCALISDGRVQCWGSGARGQLGSATRDSSRTPVYVAGLAGVTAIAAGAVHTCALLEDGTVRCWGSNEEGELGDGGVSDGTSPVDVIGLADRVTAIEAGSRHTCAILTDGDVRCWGPNERGQIGDGTTTARSEPVDVVAP